MKNELKKIAREMEKLSRVAKVKVTNEKKKAFLDIVNKKGGNKSTWKRKILNGLDFKRTYSFVDKPSLSSFERGEETTSYEVVDEKTIRVIYATLVGGETWEYEEIYERNVTGYYDPSKYYSDDYPAPCFLTCYYEFEIDLDGKIKKEDVDAENIYNIYEKNSWRDWFKHMRKLSDF